MTICIAGKNNIAVNILQYVSTHYEDYDLVFIHNRNETGQDSWQKSAKLYAERHHIPIVTLSDVYNIKDLVFLSTEYDRIIQTNRFKSDQLFNIHFSLLPKYKGFSTSILPILQGEQESGVTLHRIRDGIDTGEIIDQEVIPISLNMNSLQLYERYLEEGTKLIIKNLPNLLSGNFRSRPQESMGSSYFSSKYIDYTDLHLNVKATAYQIYNQVRAFAFRPYQLPEYEGCKLIGSEISHLVSTEKPGTILKEDKISFTIASIDYDIVLYKDVLSDLNQAIRLGNIDEAVKLCTYRPIVNDKDERGWTPLNYAIQSRNIEMVRYLISLGANTYVYDNHGKTLMMYAEESGDNSILDLVKSKSMCKWPSDVTVDN